MKHPALPHPADEPRQRREQGTQQQAHGLPNDHAPVERKSSASARASIAPTLRTNGFRAVAHEQAARKQSQSPTTTNIDV
jgi:hypothetical protein